MIFKVDKGKDFFEENPEAKAFEFLSQCSSREAKWICLTFDYFTPLRSIPMEQRKDVAAKMSGFLVERETGRLDRNARNVITGKLEKVNLAIKEFLEIQYDDDQEMLLAYKEQIAQALELMKKKNKSEREWGMCDKIVKSLPLLLSAKKELEKTLGLREEKSDAVSENEPLSTLDMFHEEE